MTFQQVRQYVKGIISALDIKKIVSDEISDTFYDNTKTGYTPVGTIITVMGNEAPKHYLKCEGQIVNIADYKELANYFEAQFGSISYFGGDGTTTFAVPDLRGEFLRGTGTNSHENQGDGANVGEHQDGTAHNNFIVSPQNTRLYGYAVTKTKNQQNLNKDSKILGAGYIRSDGTWQNASDQTALYTARPTNTSVLYCIAVRNIYVDARYDYSTDEKVVGTWIDGKPLYQKTIIDTMPSTTANGTFVYVDSPHNIENVDLIFITDGFIKAASTGSSFTHPVVYLLNAGYQLKIRPNRINIQYASSAKDYNGAETIITVIYTKTTD